MSKKHEKKKNNKTEAEPMPSLIYQNITLDDGSENEKVANEQKPSSSQRKQIRSAEDVVAHYRTHETKTKNWLWLGVLSITAIIFFFWGWSIIASVSNIDWNKTQESGLIKQTKQDWDEVFSTDKNSLITAVTLKTQVANIIEELKKQTEQDTTLNIATTTTSTSVGVTATIKK